MAFLPSGETNCNTEPCFPSLMNLFPDVFGSSKCRPGSNVKYCEIICCLFSGRVRIFLFSPLMTEFTHSRLFSPSPLFSPVLTPSPSNVEIENLFCETFSKLYLEAKKGKVLYAFLHSAFMYVLKSRIFIPPFHDLPLLSSSAVSLVSFTISYLNSVLS